MPEVPTLSRRLDRRFTFRAYSLVFQSPSRSLWSRDDGGVPPLSPWAEIAPKQLVRHAMEEATPPQLGEPVQWRPAHTQGQSAISEDYVQPCALPSRELSTAPVSEELIRASFRSLPLTEF